MILQNNLNVNKKLEKSSTTNGYVTPHNFGNKKQVAYWFPMNTVAPDISLIWNEDQKNNLLITSA